MVCIKLSIRQNLFPVHSADQNPCPFAECIDRISSLSFSQSGSSGLALLRRIPRIVCASQRSIHEHLRVHRESPILLLSVRHSTGGGVRTVFRAVPAFSVSPSERLFQALLCLQLHISHHFDLRGCGRFERIVPVT
jgi:hypothetical protein